MNPDQLLFTCEVCGHDFPVDPAMAVETLIHGECPGCDDCFSDEELAAGIAAGALVEGDELAAMTPEQLAALGLTVADRDALLRGEDVCGGALICRRCQDEAAGIGGEGEEWRDDS